MRKWLGFAVLGVILAALAMPPAYAKGTAGGARATVTPAPTVQLGFHPFAGPELVTEAPEPPPPPLPPAARLPLCHEVTPVGVVVERATACSRTLR